MNYDKELQVALEAARKAGAIVRHYFETGTEVWEKSKDNPLTLADLESDRAIQAIIKQHFPDDGILSEETVSAPDRCQKPRVWIIDPMDGTKEFTQKIPEFAVSIAMVEAGEPVVGVIFNPASNVAVWASQGAGTYRDGTRVQVSSKTQLGECVVIASRTEISREKFLPYESWFAEINPVGSIAWKLACVAAGEADLNVSKAPKNEWDVCAGDILLREAGGVYLDFQGEKRIYNQPDPLINAFMAAGSPALVKAFNDQEAQRVTNQSD